MIMFIRRHNMFEKNIYSISYESRGASLFNIKDFKYIPTTIEMSNYINHPLFDNFILYMQEKYNADPIFLI